MPQPKRLAVQSTEKTGPELFKILLDKWDDIDHEYYDCLCECIDILWDEAHINGEEYLTMKEFMGAYKGDSITYFGANGGVYWWDTKEQVKRKQFVKYLSEL